MEDKPFESIASSPCLPATPTPQNSSARICLFQSATIVARPCVVPIFSITLKLMDVWALEMYGIRNKVQVKLQWQQMFSLSAFLSAS
jgi:hypothetical protein